MERNLVFPATRVVVAQPEPPAELGVGALTVGVLPWAEFGPHLAVLVKMTLSFAPASDDDGSEEPNEGPQLARWTEEQRTLSLDQPSSAPGAAGDELYYPSDFVPRKGRAEVMLVGHAHAGSDAKRIDCRLRVGDMIRNFSVRAQDPSRAIALSNATLVSEGEALSPLGPRAVTFAPERVHPADHDYGCYNSAGHGQRLKAIAPDAEIELTGLSRHGDTRQLQLPDLQPILYASTAYTPAETLVPLHCDTLWIDSDREELVLVWRGDVELMRDLREVNRLLVALERRSEPRDQQTRLAHLLRGTFSYAVTAADVAPGAAPIPQDDMKLKIARLSSWGVKAPEPKLSVRQYATISAELAEDKDRRADVLEAHRYDEDGWTVEERCWLEKMGNAAMAGDAEIATRYADAFVEAQDALTTERERQMTATDYAALVVKMERTADPMEVLQSQEMTLAMWMRLNRRWAKAAEEDAAVSRELEEKLAAARAEAP